MAFERPVTHKTRLLMSSIRPIVSELCVFIGYIARFCPCRIDKGKSYCSAAVCFCLHYVRLSCIVVMHTVGTVYFVLTVFHVLNLDSWLNHTAYGPSLSDGLI